MTILIIADHDNTELKAATLNVLTAACDIANHVYKNSADGDIHLLIAGDDCGHVVESAASLKGISQIVIADHPAYHDQLAENVASLIVEISDNYSHILMSAGTTGKDCLPRVAALLDVAQISDIIAVESADTFKRPIYAGNAIATVQSLDPIKVITVRSSAFSPAAAVTDTATDGVAYLAKIVRLAQGHDRVISRFVSAEIAQSERPELTSAKIIIAGGRGMQNADNFALLETIADTLGAGIGASRAAVDAGFVANDLQIGQTGKIVAPELYIAVGISGAIQHLAGISGSKVIVAINKDPDAPIFDVADYGLVADLFEVLPQLSDALTALKP
jgi:electron transfer flavoprotein alpha subunit